MNRYSKLVIFTIQVSKSTSSDNFQVSFINSIILCYQFTTDQNAYKYLYGIKKLRVNDIKIKKAESVYR